MRFVKKIFIIFLSIFLLSSLIKNILNYRRQVKFYQEFESQVREERKKKIELKTQIAKKKDPYQIEKIARDKLGLSKEDEMSIIIPLPSPTPTFILPTAAPNWYRWWKVFF